MLSKKWDGGLETPDLEAFLLWNTRTDPGSPRIYIKTILLMVCWDFSIYSPTEVQMSEAEALKHTSL